MADPPGPPVEPNSQRASPVVRERRVPTRHRDFEHLALDELRAYRDMLAREETRVSYGRRLLAQAAVIESDAGGKSRMADSAQQRFSELAAGRADIVAVVPAEGLPALPEPPAGQRSAGPSPADLADSDQRLADYHDAVLGRIAAATTELIARYRERPTLAVRALPLTPVIYPRDTRY